VARENDGGYGPYRTNTFRCKVSLDLSALEAEKAQYQDLPRVQVFESDEERERILLEHLQGIYREIENVVGEVAGRVEGKG
jgi:hypothetical protein